MEYGISGFGRKTLMATERRYMSMWISLMGSYEGYVISLDLINLMNYS